MGTQSPLADEQITGEDLVSFSLEEIEEFLLQIYPALEKIFHAVSGYAQRTTPVDAQFQKVIGLEDQWQKMLQELKAGVDAIIIHAVFAEKEEQEWNRLAHVLREDMALMQTVASGNNITPEWLARRDALAAQVTSLLTSQECHCHVLCQNPCKHS